MRCHLITFFLGFFLPRCIIDDDPGIEIFFQVFVFGVDFFVDIIKDACFGVLESTNNSVGHLLDPFYEVSKGLFVDYAAVVDFVADKVSCSLLGVLLGDQFHGLGDIFLVAGCHVCD